MIIGLLKLLRGSIITKFAIIPLFIIISFVLIFMKVVGSLNHQNEFVKELYSVNMKEALEVSEIHKQVYMVKAGLTTYLAKYSINTGQDELNKILSELNSNNKILEESLISKTDTSLVSKDSTVLKSLNEQELIRLDALKAYYEFNSSMEECMSMLEVDIVFANMSLGTALENVVILEKFLIAQNSYQKEHAKTQYESSLALSEDLKSSIFTIFLVVLLAIITISIIVSYMIIRPIKVIAAFFNSYSTEDREAKNRIKLNSVDEIGQLANSINDMVAKIEKNAGEAESLLMDAEMSRKAADAMQSEAMGQLKVNKKIGNFQKEEISKISDLMNKLSQGQFVETYVVSDCDSDTEKTASIYTNLSDSINVMILNVAGIIRSLRESSDTLSNFSVNMSGESEKLVENSNIMSNESNNVVVTVDEMNINISTVAAAVEEMSVNISTVSGSTARMSDEMTSISNNSDQISDSIGTIASNTQQAGTIALKADELSDNASDTMDSLGVAAQEIGQVTSVIKRIAEQTNLLALNATIEAASAGEAGKGFAVVANEIKELATQSSKAAEDISKKINGIQDNSSNAINAIVDISTTINDISKMIKDIASSVEEQNISISEMSTSIANVSSSSDEIANNILEISKGSTEVAGNVGDVASNSSEIAERLQLMNQKIQEANYSSKKVGDASGEMITLIDSLKYQVGEFSINA